MTPTDAPLILEVKCLHCGRLPGECPCGGTVEEGEVLEVREGEE